MQPSNLKLENLPNDLLIQILLFLDLKTLMDMSLVSKRLKKVNKELYKNFYSSLINRIDQLGTYISTTRNKWNISYEDYKRQLEYRRNIKAYLERDDFLRLKSAFERLQDISVIGKNTAKFPHIHSVFNPTPENKIFEINLFILGLAVFIQNTIEHNVNYIMLGFVLMAVATAKDQLYMKTTGFGSGLAKRNISSEVVAVKKHIKDNYSENKEFIEYKKIFFFQEFLVKKQKRIEQNPAREKDNREESNIFSPVLALNEPGFDGMMRDMTT